DDLVDGLAAGDAAAVYGTVDRLVEAGHDPRRFAADLLDRLRDLVLLRAVPDAASRGLVNAPGDELDRMSAQAQRLGPATLTRAAAPAGARRAAAATARAASRPRRAATGPPGTSPPTRRTRTRTGEPRRHGRGRHPPGLVGAPQRGTQVQPQHRGHAHQRD